MSEIQGDFPLTIMFNCAVMEHIVKILSIIPVTHDVKSFRFEKPAGYRYTPGQATDVSINQPGLRDELRPFTFTSLNEDEWLEFTIKRYPERHGITDRIHRLRPGDELIIRNAWGAIEYRGPGYFLAGGAGITPFLAILRQLYKDQTISGHMLFFSNKTSADIIYEEELKKMLGEQVHFVLTREQKRGYEHARLNREYLAKQGFDFGKHFYVCGPDAMIADVNGLLTNMGALPETLVFEK